MARCKLTRMSLRNIRKDKQYQCIVIDFVRTGVINKSKAEELLNYTIPAGLLEGSVAAPDDDDDEPGTGTGGEGTGGETAKSVTLAVNLTDMASQLGAAVTPKDGDQGGRDTVPKGGPSGAESDGWLLVNFPLPEEDRWLARTETDGFVYNTDLFSSMYDAIKDAVVATEVFTAENFETYFAPTVDGHSKFPWIVTANEDYQIGEDNWGTRFIIAEKLPAELTDGMILSYTEPAGADVGVDVTN